MKKLLYAAAVAVLVCSCRGNICLDDVADSVIRQAPSWLDYGHYAGCVYTQGLAEYALETGRHKSLSDSLASLFESGSRTGYGSFVCYQTGGTMIPILACNGYPQYAGLASRTASRMWDKQPRNEDSLMVPPWCDPSKNPIFADCVLAVTPYFLYSGLLEKRQDYVEYAAKMTLDTFRDLRDAETGLIHQARGVMWMERGQMTSDCWSRSNGWGAMALAALLRDYPKDGPRRKEIDTLSVEFFKAVLRFQDSDGLWHQEMTFEDSYPEISGTGLLLYGIGRAIEAGVLGRREYLPAFRKGLEGMLRYIDVDGNVCNVCSGCLAWGDGGKEAYAAHEYYCNDPHAFGPVLMAISQAHALGIRRVESSLGACTEGKTPACFVRFVPERKGDIAWENDRAAFRVYSQEVKGSVSSGVDYWGKRVDYPIINKWYDLNAKGLEYHVDRGEGRDFYVVGKNRGVGGPGIMLGGELLVPEPYESYEILTNTRKKISFSLHYPPIMKDGAILRLSETIEMVLGTPFFKKTYTLDTEGNAGDALIATGLTHFGNAQLYAQDGVLSLSEDLGSDGLICSAVIANPKAFASYAHVGEDHLLLMKPGAGATCLVGIAWSGDIRWRSLPGEWNKMVSKGYGELCDF